MTSTSAPMRSLQRVSDILDCLVRSGGEITLPDLIAELGMSSTSVRRTLTRLRRQGYVLMDKERVSLGPRTIRLGYTASEQLGRWTRPVLVGVAANLRETAALSVLDADRVVVQEQARGPYQLDVVLDVGSPEPPHCSAAGKMLLAQLPDPELLSLLARMPLDPVAGNTITDQDELHRHIELIRRQEYAVEDSERIEGVRSVAVAIPNAPRNLALSVSAPEGRLSLVSVGNAVITMREAADQISRWLHGSSTEFLPLGDDAPR